MIEEEKFIPPEAKKEVLNWPELISQELFFQIRDSLKTPESVVLFEEWRKLDEEGREARQLRKISEILMAVNSILEKYPDKRKEIAQAVLDSLNLEKNISSRSRINQFQALLAAEVFGLEKPKVRKEIERLFESLKKLKSTEGELDASELLTSAKTDFGLKREWVLAHFLPRINFLLRRDIEEAKKIPFPLPEKPLEGQPLSIPELPPEQQDFCRPSIEEKRGGEPKGYFNVFPFYGGCWREKTFGKWDAKNICFKDDLPTITKTKNVDIDEKTERVMTGIIKGKTKTSIPCAYGFGFKPETLKCSGKKKIEILQDDEGNYFLESKNKGIVSFTISLGKKKEAVEKKGEAPQVAEIEIGKLSSETEKFLTELKQEKITPLEKARRLKQYVKKILEYPAKGDSSFNAVYYQDPTKFFQKIEQHKKADCDVANSFFIALLSRLEIPARLATGHYIKIGDHQDRAVFSSNSRYAWTEVWDNGWHRLDATPRGAPELDEEEIDEKEEDKDLEGGFGEIEAEILSDEKLEEMIRKIKEMQEEKKERKKSPEEIRVLNFAKEAECSTEEAKVILAQIERARQLRDSQGRNILDLLSQEFMKIIRENLKKMLSYRTPVRLPEADELEEPVEAYVDIKTGEVEPGGFKKFEQKFERVQEYGGFDLILVCDKSSSMAETDPSTGEKKWKEQQKFVYLIAEALHRFSYYCKRHRIRLLEPIDVRTGLITFQDGGHEVILPLSDEWGPKEQYKLWQKLEGNTGGGTPDHLGLKAAQKNDFRRYRKT